MKLSDIIDAASERSQRSQVEGEARRDMYKVPWLDVSKHGLPQNDWSTPLPKRRQHLVKVEGSGFAIVALFGLESHDWWVTPMGQLLTPAFGCTVTHWAPLPPPPDSKSGQPLPIPAGNGGSPGCAAHPESR